MARDPGGRRVGAAVGRTALLERAQHQAERDHHEGEDLGTHEAHRGGAADAEAAEEGVGEQQVEQLREARLLRVRVRARVRVRDRFRVRVRLGVRVRLELGLG